MEYTDDDSGVSDDRPEEVPETSPYPDIDGVDWKAARSTAADQESLRIIMDKFCSMAPREAAELDSYYAGIIDGIGSAVTSYRIKVHSMKNSAALVGALQLSDVARGLEKAADTGDTEFIKAGHEAFCNEYTAMVDRIRLALTGEKGLYH